MATYLTPKEAWQSQIAGKADHAKTGPELAPYERKKKIDKQYDTGGDKRRGDAIEALRKRLDGDKKKFDNLSLKERAFSSLEYPP